MLWKKFACLAKLCGGPTSTSSTILQNPYCVLGFKRFSAQRSTRTFCTEDAVLQIWKKNKLCSVFTNRYNRKTSKGCLYLQQIHPIGLQSKYINADHEYYGHFCLSVQIFVPLPTCIHDATAQRRLFHMSLECIGKNISRSPISRLAMHLGFWASNKFLE